jgi:ATP-dependent RNA helicase
MIIESTEDLEVVKSFDDLGFREELLRGIYAYGYTKPSAV